MQATTKPTTYIADNCDGTWDAFVSGKGFRSGCSLPQATAFVRENTGRTSGSVPCWNRSAQEWDSELDLAEGA